MMYSEFLKLANLTENDIPFDVYTNEIELAYRDMPDEIVKDKQAFVKWWKANRELCRWISKRVADADTMTKEYCKEANARKEAEKAIAERDTRINALTKDNEQIAKKLVVIKLRAAFAPEVLTKDMKLLFFDNYEEAKRVAIENGIIKG